MAATVEVLEKRTMLSWGGVCSLSIQEFEGYLVVPNDGVDQTGYSGADRLVFVGSGGRLEFTLDPVDGQLFGRIGARLAGTTPSPGVGGTTTTRLASRVPPRQVPDGDQAPKWQPDGPDRLRFQANDGSGRVVVFTLEGPGGPATYRYGQSENVYLAQGG